MIQMLLRFVLSIPVIAICINLLVMAESKHEIVLFSDVEWEQLNPARGDKSPAAGTLWGNRSGLEPTGFLVKFVDGFSSPPHIHNVTYRGVVISGHIHNDDPNAEKMWMPAGSFWTQPVGETHITAAKGSYNLAYIEIDKGPYLVLPAKEAFDSGERPINIDESNIVWINQRGNSTNAVELKMAYLWGKPHSGKFYGAFVKLPTSLTVKIHNGGSTFHAVVIKGPLQYHTSEAEVTNMNPGSYFNSTGKSVHKVSNKIKEDTIIYVRTNGKLEFTH